MNRLNYIYILELEGGRYYVDRSTDVNKAFQEHLNGLKSSWTRKYKPLRIVRATTHGTEDYYVKQCMKLYGINYVRGGSYSEDELSELDQHHLIAELWPPENTYVKPITETIPDVAVDGVNLLRTGVSKVFGAVSDVFGVVRDVIKPSSSK